MIRVSKKKRLPALADVTSHLIGLEYQLGHVDCFSIIIVYLRAMKVELPSQYEGLTLDTYAELYKESPDKAKTAMLDFLDTIGTPVAPNRVQPGDILLVRLRAVGTKQQFAFPAINAGNGHLILASEKHGVVMLPMKYYRRLRGWKCLQR